MSDCLQLNTWRPLTCSSKAVPLHFCPAVWQSLTCRRHERLIAWANRREISTGRTEEGRCSSMEETVVHKTPRMGPERVESLLLGRGHGETHVRWWELQQFLKQKSLGGENTRTLSGMEWMNAYLCRSSRCLRNSWTASAHIHSFQAIFHLFSTLIVYPPS